MLARKALAGTAGAPKEYVEDVFSTYLYTGTGASQAITNNIDLSGKGGLVWIKGRNFASNHWLADTERGNTKYIRSNTTGANLTYTDLITSFNNNGFTLGTDSSGDVNTSPNTHVSWTFRKAKKFFDVVTYTGNGTARTISHNLGSTPGMIIVKRTDTTGSWFVYHRSLSSATNALRLNSTSAEETDSTIWNGTAPTSSVFSVGTFASVNENNGTYVAYLFAHDAGGFGDSGSDSIIKCGSFSQNSAVDVSVDLGWEPQWVIVKQSAGATSQWYMMDNMRGFGAAASSNTLYANLSDAEGTFAITANATGFVFPSGQYSSGSNTYIYIAIRRGPMKTPTSGTDVFYSQTISQADSIDSTGVPFPPDLVNTFSRDGTQRTTGYTLFQFADRLRSLGTPDDSYGTTKEGKALVSSSTSPEYGNLTNYSYIQLKADGRNITRSNGWNSASYGNWLNYFWRRAPGFFDVVCYTGGNSTNTRVTHNLGVAPELIIVKPRSATGSWGVYVSSEGRSKYMLLNNTIASTSFTDAWGTSNPTTTDFGINDSGSGFGYGTATMVAYLFASVSGVSKVGSYTGNGSSQTINCGFTNGARFILIKRTDSTGDWYVYDSARGIVSGNDPQLKLNSDVAEATGYDAVDPNNSGFIVNNDATNFPINVNNATYIYLAIA